MFNVITIAPFSFTPDADQECQKKLEQYPADQLLIVDGLCEVDDSQLNSWLKLQSLQAADIAAAANALAERPNMPSIDFSKWLKAHLGNTLLLMEMVSHYLLPGTQVACTFEIDDREFVTCKIASKKKLDESHVESPFSEVSLFNFDPWFEELEAA